MFSVLRAAFVAEFGDSLQEKCEATVQLRKLTIHDDIADSV
jgi:hypothetical protein